MVFQDVFKDANVQDNWANSISSFSSDSIRDIIQYIDQNRSQGPFTVVSRFYSDDGTEVLWEGEFDLA